MTMISSKGIIWDILNDPKLSPYFLFMTFSYHPQYDRKNIMGWSIEAKLAKPLPQDVGAALEAIIPPKVKKDAKDGRWVLCWKGFYDI